MTLPINDLASKQTLSTVWIVPDLPIKINKQQTVKLKV